jgi:Flp pilus assembly protein TadG
MAALEFGLIAPILTTILAGGYDAATAMTAWEQVNAAAKAVVESAEKASVQPDGTFDLTTIQARTAMTAVYAEIPGLPGASNSAPTQKGSFSVTLSSVALTPAGCQITNSTACTANTAWSTVLSVGPSGQLLNSASLLRPCGPLTITSSFTPPPGTIETSDGFLYPLGVVPIKNVQQPMSMLIADVQYNYKPLFFTFVTGPITLWGSAAFPVPGGPIDTTYVTYTQGQNDTSSQICSGYT